MAVQSLARTLMYKTCFFTLLILSSCSGNAQPELPAQGSLKAEAGSVVMSGIQNETSKARAISIRNTAASTVTVTSLNLSSSQGQEFELVDSPTLPFTLASGESVTLLVRLTAQPVSGVATGTLQLKTAQQQLTVDLRGLRAKGLEGDKEPPLAQIVQALGYQANLGTTGLLLGTQAAPVGDEVLAPLFTKSGTELVKLTPVARYSPAGPSPFGYFRVGSDQQAKQIQLGDMVNTEYQTLNPELQTGSQTEFDPGVEPFGIYLAPNNYSTTSTYTLDSLNTGRLTHTMRVFPLKNLKGDPIPNTYLIGAEPAVNGDYQDVVFVIENVRPVTP